MIENNPSWPNAIVPNRVSNVDTSDSSKTTGAENYQIPGTCKLFEHYKNILIAEQNLFWIYHVEIFSREVASFFENTEMYGQVANVP